MEKNNSYRLLKTTSINKLPLVLMVFTLIFIVLAVANAGKKLIVYNHTNSISRGFYRLSYDRTSALKRGELIVFDVPKPFRKMVIERHWLNENDTLTKPVAATDGDHVCTDNRSVRVKAASYGEVKSHDSKGRQLPWYHQCSSVKKDDIFVFINHSNSFDSRYYGPIKVDAIKAKAVPLWTF